MKLSKIFNIINGSNSKVSFNSFGGAEEREFFKLANFALFKIENSRASTEGTQ